MKPTEDEKSKAFKLFCKEHVVNAQEIERLVYLQFWNGAVNWMLERQKKMVCENCKYYEFMAGETLCHKDGLFDTGCSNLDNSVIDPFPDFGCNQFEAMEG